MDEDAETDLQDEVYEIVFEHLKRFRRDELVHLGLFRVKPNEHEEGYFPFYYIADRLIRAKGIGEENSLQTRKNRKMELDQIDAVLKILDKTTLDELSTSILSVAAINMQLRGDELKKIHAALNKLAALGEDKGLYETIEPVLAARKKEIEIAGELFGKTNVVADFVAEECRVVWFAVTGEEPPKTFKNLDQGFPQFVDAVFQILFKAHGQRPSARTALARSFEEATKQILVWKRVGREKYLPTEYPNDDDTD